MKTSIRYSLNRSLLGLFALIFAYSASGQCIAPTLKFHSPVLIYGTNGQVGAIYNFAQVAPGLDAQIEITGLYGGATLNNIDDTAGVGYYDAFQPYVGAGANDTSYLDWRITFKKGGTNIDTTLPCVAVTGVDVDGDGSNLKEFIEAATPGSFSIDPSTNLQISFDGVRSKAISPVANIPLIDTNHLEAMFQMNFTNITTLEYRNGAITTAGAQVRQTCIYFKPFFNTYIMLPKTLLSFEAAVRNDVVAVSWKAVNETGLQHYTLQRSIDGRAWKNIGNVAVRDSHGTNDYVVNDFSEFTETTYFRLMEVSKDGGRRFSSIVKVSPAIQLSSGFALNTLFTGAIQVQAEVSAGQQYSIGLYGMNGQPVCSQKYSFRAGVNTAVLQVPSSHHAGVYLLVVKNTRGEQVYQSKVVKTN
jgi:hypothetical protein